MSDTERLEERLEELAAQQEQHERKYSDGEPSVTPPPSAEPVMQQETSRLGRLWMRYSGWVGVVVVIGSVVLFIIGTLADKANSEPYEPLLQGTVMALTDPLSKGTSQTLVADRCSVDSGLEQISISSGFEMVALPDGSEPPLDAEGNPPYLVGVEDFRIEFKGQTNGRDDFCDQRNFTFPTADQMVAGFWVYAEHYFATVPESDQVVHAETDIFEVTD